MTESVLCREATRGDLPQVLRLYAQPGFDHGEMLALGFERHGYSYRTEVRPQQLEQR